MKKTIKRITALALTVTLGIFSLTACGKKEKKAETADIVIGTANGSLCLAPLHVAIDNGYFEEEFEKAGVTWKVEEIDMTFDRPFMYLMFEIYFTMP